jgi:hypothetical protein
VGGGDRYDIIEAGPRGRRGGWIIAAVLAVLVGGPLIGLLTSRDETTQPVTDDSPAARPSPSQTDTVTGSTDNALTPVVRTEAGRATMRVTFPDGTRARVSYPSELDLAGMGVRPATGIRHAEGDRFYQLVAQPPWEAGIGDKPRLLRDLADDVTLWAKPEIRGRGYVMAFDFGKWTMTLTDPVLGGPTFEERLDLARELHGSVDDDGFLVLRAGESVELAEPGQLLGSVAIGPQLWFGGEVDKPLVALALTPGCETYSPLPPTRPGRPFNATACAGEVKVAVAGDPSYAEALLAGLRVETLDRRGD